MAVLVRGRTALNPRKNSCPHPVAFAHHVLHQ